MTLLEELRELPVDQAAEFIFEVSMNPCIFCTIPRSKCKYATMISNPEEYLKDWDEYKKAKQICVDQITVGLLQEV